MVQLKEGICCKLQKQENKVTRILVMIKIGADKTSYLGYLMKDHDSA